MDNFNLMPIAAKPVNRISSGQLPAELAELSEETLSHMDDASSSSSSASVRASYGWWCSGMFCSYDGDDAE